MNNPEANSGRIWEIGLIDSAWHGSKFAGHAGHVQARQIGYEALDLFVGYDPGRLSGGERERLIEEVGEVGLPVRSVIATSLGLNDFNPAVRDFHIARACSVIDLGAELGTVRNLLFVPGEYMFQRKLLPSQSEWEAVVDAVRTVGRHAGERGLDVAIELLPFEHAFIATIHDMERLLDSVGLANVQAAIDVSHLWLQRIPAAEIRRLAGRVAQVHIADCDGEHHGDLPPGRGTTPFGDYLAVLNEIGYRGSASVELEFPEHPDQMIDWVSEAYRSTREILVSTGLRPDLARGSE